MLQSFVFSYLIGWRVGLRADSNNIPPLLFLKVSSFVCVCERERVPRLAEVSSTVFSTLLQPPRGHQSPNGNQACPPEHHELLAQHHQTLPHHSSAPTHSQPSRASQLSRDSFWIWGLSSNTHRCIPAQPRQLLDPRTLLQHPSVTARPLTIDVWSGNTGSISKVFTISCVAAFILLFLQPLLRVNAWSSGGVHISVWCLWCVWLLMWTQPGLVVSWGSLTGVLSVCMLFVWTSERILNCGKEWVRISESRWVLKNVGVYVSEKEWERVFKSGLDIAWIK